MRASARRKSRLARMAISTKEDRVGSLKAFHHSTSSTGLGVVLLGWAGVTTFWPSQVSGTLVSGGLVIRAHGAAGQRHQAKSQS